MDISSDGAIRLGIYGLEISLALSLILWMRASSPGRKESWLFFLKILAAGAIAALISAYVEIKYSFNLVDLQTYAPDLFGRYAIWYDLINNIAASSVEELAKYLVAVLTILGGRHVHKLSDAIVYLIIIGLGFSLIEDAIFLINPEVIAPYRLLSFYVHSGTSAVIGYSLGRYMSGVARWPELIISIVGAILLHFGYNLATTLQDGNLSLYLTAAITAYISLQIFILFRKAIEEEYRLGHRFAGGTTLKLLNLKKGAKA